ncbi:uncharacterized protein [Watersipora subatra]|uniref:uncharacterized protein n=1 Tax=Watersipora subatra TaxID=2589382 RepID=UPI00355C2B3E
MKAQRVRPFQQCRNVLCIGFLVLVICLLLLFSNFLGSVVERWKQEAQSICTNSPKWYTETSCDFDCHVGETRLKQRLKLLADISSALNKTQGLHWLCYGTLWGVLRGSTLLEYDRDGDICTISISQEELVDIITHLPGTIKYTQNYTSYHIWRDLAEVEITSFVYSSIRNDNTDEYMIIREGYSNLLVSRSCKPEAFPERFIKPPLSRKLLDGVYFPVPRDSYEIQMYIYPEDWYYTATPVCCQ